MPKAAPFTFQLTPEEADAIRGAIGQGGQQTLHRRLVKELESSLIVSFDDSQLGLLIRYMTQYGQGGFQSRLRTAFIRSLKKQLALN